MNTPTPPPSDAIAPSDETIIRAARLMASRAMSQRNHYERMADSFTHAYNERDAGLRKAYDEAARSFGELAYQVADQFHIPGSEIEPAREIAAQPGEGDKYRRALQTIHDFAGEGGTHWEWAAARVARTALGIGGDDENDDS